MTDEERYQQRFMKYSRIQKQAELFLQPSTLMLNTQEAQQQNASAKRGTKSFIDELLQVGKKKDQMNSNNKQPSEDHKYKVKIAQPSIALQNDPAPSHENPQYEPGFTVASPLK